MVSRPNDGASVRIGPVPRQGQGTGSDGAKPSRLGCRTKPTVGRGGTTRRINLNPGRSIFMGTTPRRNKGHSGAACPAPRLGRRSFSSRPFGRIWPGEPGAGGDGGCGQWRLIAATTQTGAAFFPRQSPANSTVRQGFPLSWLSLVSPRWRTTTTRTLFATTIHNFLGLCDRPHGQGTKVGILRGRVTRNSRASTLTSKEREDHRAGPRDPWTVLHEKGSPRGGNEDCRTGSIPSSRSTAPPPPASAQPPGRFAAFRENNRRFGSRDGGTDRQAVGQPDEKTRPRGAQGD